MHRVEFRFSLFSYGSKEEAETMARDLVKGCVMGAGMTLKDNAFDDSRRPSDGALGHLELRIAEVESTDDVPVFMPVTLPEGLPPVKELGKGGQAL